VRDWRIYADFAQSLIAIARPLYVDEPFGVDLKESVYALDTTTIDLCLSVFSWVPFRSTKAAVKLHTLLDLRGNIQTFIHISDGKMHEANILDQLLSEKQCISPTTGSDGDRARGQYRLRRRLPVGIEAGLLTGNSDAPTLTEPLSNTPIAYNPMQIATANANMRSGWRPDDHFGTRRHGAAPSRFAVTV
jgi:hypothetical protein